MKRPPAAASKIVTLIASPMPKVISFAGRRSAKEWTMVGAQVARMSTT
jgi:hypothetical protein